MTREQEIKGEKQYSRIKEIVVVLLSACNLAKKKEKKSDKSITLGEGENLHVKKYLLHSSEVMTCSQKFHHRLFTFLKISLPLDKDACSSARMFPCMD